MLSRFGIEVTRKRIALSLIGSAILAFGLYNVHAFAGVMEGGVPYHCPIPADVPVPMPKK